MIVNENTSVSSDIEAFNWVTDHLIKQDVQSKDNTGGCLYRGPDGTACAVGCLISDKDYVGSFETTCADDDHIIEAVSSSNPNWKITPTQHHMLLVLQYVHDNHTPYTWQYDFDSLRMVLFPDGKNYDIGLVTKRIGGSVITRDVKQFVSEAVSLASQMRKGEV